MNDAVFPEPQRGALTVIRAELPTVLAADQDDILGKLQRELAGFEGDASTERGRKEIASKAYKVSTAKKDLERLATTLKADAQKTIHGVNAEVRVIKERMDALRDQVRKPLDDYEARIAQFEADIKAIEGWAHVPTEWTAEQIAARIAELQQHEFTRRDWQEFAPRAQKAATVAFNALTGAKMAAERREAAEAEAARLAAEEAERRRQEEERQQQEREAEIARQAAEQARQEAERLAQAEREAAARREQEAREAAERAERQRQETEARAQREREAAETARIERHRNTIESLDTADRFRATQPTAAAIQARIDQVSAVSLELDEFSQEGHQTRDATLTRLRAMLAEAQERERRQAELLAEQQRQAAEAAAAAQLRARQEAEDAERKRREANVAHRRSINRGAAQAIQKVMQDAGLGDGAFEPLAQKIVAAIAKGEVPAVRIEY